MDFVDSINTIVSLLNNYLYSYILIFVLLGAGLFYTIRTRFVQFDFKNILFAIKESTSVSGEKSENKISPFEAFAVTTASRVGTGNLAGVALAITVGGPGAIFWMWVTALIGGALAFAESTLAQVFKTPDKSYVDSKHFLGGPSFYMQNGMGSKTLGVTFACILILVFGISFNTVQSNTIANAFQNSFNIPTLYTAIALSLLSAIFIFKGLPSIARASAIIVPIMSIIYLMLCLFVIGSNITRIPEVFGLIFENAFGIREFGTGTIIGTITTGIKRGLFSNEAGMGSAPNAAASASTSHPVKQGLIQSLGVFFDTLLICSATGFLILFSGVDFSNPDTSGIVLTQAALDSYFGNFGNIFLSVCIFLLAFSSVLGNYFYAQNSVSFLSSNKTIKMVFQFVVIASVFIGSISTLSFVWNLADLLMGIMALLNLIAILKLSHIVIAVLKDYQKQKKSGKDPVFKKSVLTPEDADKVTYWS